MRDDYPELEEMVKEIRDKLGSRKRDDKLLYEMEMIIQAYLSTYFEEQLYFVLVARSEKSGFVLGSCAQKETILDILKEGIRMHTVESDYERVHKQDSVTIQ